MTNIISSPNSNNITFFLAEEVGEEMMARLSWMTLQPKVILQLGGGDEIRRQLKERYPEAEIIMETQGPVDLIFGHFYLSQRIDVKSCMAAWLRLLNPNGVLMLSMLGLNTLQEWHKHLDQDSLTVLIDMHDVGDALIQGGFKDPVLDVEYLELVYRDKHRFIDEMQCATFCFQETAELLPTADGVWPVTCEIIYAHAFAPMSYQTEEGEVAISLAQMRQRLRG